MKRKYSEIASAAGVGDSVVFAGACSEGLERYYKASDCFAMLSSFDTFGMVVLEAMASSLPVIISSGVGAKDLVEEGVNGFVVGDPSDAAAASERMLLLLDMEKRFEMGRRALKTASSHDWDSSCRANGGALHGSAGPKGARKERGLMDLSVIIVTYNSADYIAECLSSVLASEGVSLEVFVVDNASSDKGASLVREKFPNVRLIVNSANKGLRRGQQSGHALLLRQVYDPSQP